MNKTELVAAMAKKAEITQKDAEKALAAFTSVVTDASVISSISDACVLVIRENRAPVNRIRMAIDDINSNGAEVIGCVYKNSAVTKKHSSNKYGGYYGSYGSYGSYGYGHSYGYGYGNDKK